MIRNRVTVALCLAALGLTACSDNRGRMAANSKICADFKSGKTNPAALAGIPAEAQALDECVRRWAYSLASSRDDAEVVADAAASACSGALAKWNQQSLSQGSQPDALSLTTGQPTNALAEHNNFAHSRALFHVVAARAGRCDAPPVKDGLPEGLPPA